jgi:hypothetical protein
VSADISCVGLPWFLIAPQPIHRWLRRKRVFHAAVALCHCAAPVTHARTSLVAAKLDRLASFRDERVPLTP